jgi:hypothetical protein
MMVMMIVVVDADDADADADGDDDDDDDGDDGDGDGGRLPFETRCIKAQGSDACPSSRRGEVADDAGFLEPARHGFALPQHVHMSTT